MLPVFPIALLLYRKAIAATIFSRQTTIAIALHSRGIKSQFIAAAQEKTG
jgi:hypothetical protein